MEMVEYQEAPSHGKKYIWKFTCSASRPFQKGSLYKLLPIFEVCIFMSKKELWKNTARREADFYRPMSNLFFISKILSVTIGSSHRVCCCWCFCTWDVLHNRIRNDSPEQVCVCESTASHMQFEIRSTLSTRKGTGHSVTDPVQWS